MNDVKMLKVALVAVIVASAGFIGYSYNRQHNLERATDTLVVSLRNAETAEDANAAVGVYFSQVDSGVNASSADAGWWKKFKKWAPFVPSGASSSGGSQSGGMTDAEFCANGQNAYSSICNPY